MLKRQGSGVDHSVPHRAEVKERVELIIYPFRAFMAGYSVNFMFLCNAHTAFETDTNSLPKLLKRGNNEVDGLTMCGRLQELKHN
jgi:hypothetical protein